MSGFDPRWLELREAVDHRSRDAALFDRLVSLIGRRSHLTLLDLGCGTGSNLRFLAPRLPHYQYWRLIDKDPRLLGICGATSFPDVTCILEAADISSGIASWLDPVPDLVTASALFDLVSEDWIKQLANDIAARSIPLYTVLTYDGHMEWTPSHSLDGTVLDAFHLHQGGDKDFGPAAGPRATAALRYAFLAHGYEVETADSAWRLDQADAPLLFALIDGVAAAVRETGMLSAAELGGWHSFRRERTRSALISHMDLLAKPHA